MPALAEIHHAFAISTSAVGQHAALAALTGPQDCVEEMRLTYDARRRALCEGLEAMGIPYAEPQGAFYAFPSFKDVLGREIGGATPQTTLELADIMLEQAKVAIVPGEAFGAPGYARLSFALGDDDLGEGVQRIADLIQG